MPAARGERFQIGRVGLLDVGDVVNGLASPAEPVAGAFVVSGSGKEQHGFLDVPEPPVGVLAQFAGQAAGVEDVAVSRVVGSEGELHPHLHRQLGIEPAEEVIHVLHAGVYTLFRVMQFGETHLPARGRHHLHEPLGADPAHGIGIEPGLLVHLGRDQAPVLSVVSGVLLDVIVERRKLTAQVDPQRIPGPGYGTQVLEVLFAHQVEEQPPFLLLDVPVERGAKGGIVPAHGPSQRSRLDAERGLQVAAIGLFHFQQVGIGHGHVVDALVDADQDVLRFDVVRQPDDFQSLDGIGSRLERGAKRRTGPDVHRAAGQVRETRDPVFIRADHHQFLHVVVRYGEIRLRLPFFVDRHGRGDDVPLPLVQIVEQFAVVVRDDDFQPEIVPPGEFLQEFVFETDLHASVDEIGERVVPRDHAQPPAILQTVQVVGENAFAGARDLPGQENLVDFLLQFVVSGPHQQDDLAVFRQHERRGQFVVRFLDGIPQVVVADRGLELAAGDPVDDAFRQHRFRYDADAQSGHLLLQLQQGLVVCAGRPDADLHAGQVIEAFGSVFSGGYDQVFVDEIIGYRIGGFRLPVGCIRKVRGDDVSFAPQEPVDHGTVVVDRDQPQVQLQRFGNALCHVKVELDRFGVAGQMVDGVRADEDADDAPCAEFGEIPGVPGRFRQPGTIAKYRGRTDHYGREKQAGGAIRHPFLHTKLPVSGDPDRSAAT